MHTYFNLSNWTPMVRAIRDDPDNDTIKLALADELMDSDEEGAEDRGKLIQVSIELANIPEPFRRVRPRHISGHEQDLPVNYEKSGIMFEGKELIKEVEVVRATFLDDDIQGVKLGEVLRIDQGPVAGRYGQGYIKVAHCAPNAAFPFTDVYGRWYDFVKDENFERRKLLEHQKLLYLNRVICGHVWDRESNGNVYIAGIGKRLPIIGCVKNTGLVYVNWHKGFPVDVHCSSSWWAKNGRQALDLEPFVNLRVPYIPNVLCDGNKFIGYESVSQIHDSVQYENVKELGKTFPEVFLTLWGAKLKTVETNTVRGANSTTVIRFTLTFTTTSNPVTWTPNVLHTYSMKQVFGYDGADVYVANVVGNPMPNRTGLWEVYITFELGRYPGQDAQYSNFEAHIPDLF